MAPPHRGTPGDQIDGTEAKTQFLRHERWLRTVIYARTGQAEAVEEVLQEVAVAFIDGRTRPSDMNRPAPWLYRVAVRQSMLYRRKSGRQEKLVRSYSERKQLSKHDPNAADPLEWMLANERRDLVRLGLEQMTSKDREILLLRYTEDWNYRDLSEHLGVSVAAVESRLHRARERLRTELARVHLIESK